MSNKTAAPKLRFPEFQDKWEQYFGNELFDPISNKDHDSSLPVLAITQEHGAIPRDFIDYQVYVTDKSIESYKVVDVGDFIISLRSFQGGIEYSRYKGICSPAYIILRKNTDVSETYFKYFFKTERFIQQLQKNLEGLRDGKMVSYQQFSELLLPAPSIDEQQKIADCLTSLDDLISLQSQKVDALKAYKKGLLQNLFPAEGESLPRLRFPEFYDAGEWVDGLLGDIATITSGGTPDRSNKDFWNGNIPWVTTSLIDFNTIYYTNEYISEAGLKDSSAKLFPKNTILMAMYGQGKTRGKVAVLGIEATTNQACAAILLKKELDITFLFQNLSSRYDEIRELSNSGGQANLSAGLIETIPFSYPIDKNEQQKIAEFLTSIDEQIAAQSQRLAAMQVHKKGLLQGLFPSAGEVEK